MLAIVLLKGLSTFEFSMRDKTVTYEDLYVQDFSPKGRGLLKKLTSTTKDRDNSTYLKLNFDVAAQKSFRLPIDSSFVFNSRDTGYIEIKLKTNLPSTIPTSLVWIDVDNLSTVITDLNQKIKGDQIIKSELFPFQNFHQLELRFLQPEGRDSLVPVASANKASCFLDYVKFVKEVKQEQVF